jgi:Uma2 family endonuclease
MATKPQIGVEEYLALAHPDRPESDYVHGEVVSRSLPTPIHAQIQALLVLLFGKLLPQVRVTLLTELRVQIEPNLFRVVDFAVYRDSPTAGRYAIHPAFVVVEIVSPDDRYTDLTQRLEDYRRWGVPHIWLIDPWLRRVYEYTEAGLLQHAALRLTDLDFQIAPEQLFKDIQAGI